MPYVNVSLIAVMNQTRKAVGLILALGGILYLFMHTRINNGADVSGVLFQPVSTGMVREKTVAYGQSLNVTKILPSRDQSSLNRSSTVFSNRKIIIIIAYMRTGSTLTASLFQEYPNTFYVFEPIRSVYMKFKRAMEQHLTSTELHYIHGMERNFTISQRLQVELDEINNWLTCKLGSISKESLGDDFHKDHTKIMKVFSNCNHGIMPNQRQSNDLDTHRIFTKYYDTTKRTDSCLKKAIHSCQKSTIMVLKFIRLRMKEIEKILPLYPNMKVIHLVRDPRAIINSRMKVNTLKPSIYEENIKKLCDALKEDLKYSKTILQHYPDKLKVVHYEDMAEHPMQTTKSLLDFAGLQFTKHMQDFLLKQTHSARDSCAYCTQRRDSNATAHKWRTELDPKKANYIYDNCILSSGVLGYLPLSTVSSLRNTKIASRQPFYVNKLLLNKNF